MELFIQMGHNMQALALEHLEEFDGGTIIISPMNILPNKVKGYATRVHKKKGKVLVIHNCIILDNIKKIVSVCILAEK